VQRHRLVGLAYEHGPPLGIGVQSDSPYAAVVLGIQLSHCPNQAYSGLTSVDHCNSPRKCHCQRIGVRHWHSVVGIRTAGGRLSTERIGRPTRRRGPRAQPSGGPPVGVRGVWQRLPVGVSDDALDALQPWCARDVNPSEMVSRPASRWMRLRTSIFDVVGSDAPTGAITGRVGLPATDRGSVDPSQLLLGDVSRRPAPGPHSAQREGSSGLNSFGENDLYVFSAD